LLADEFPVFNFDLSGGKPTPVSARHDIPVIKAGVCHALVFWIRLHLDGEAQIDNRPLFAGETTADSYCAHWYQVAKLMVPPIAVEPGMALRIEARHNRQNVAVVVYDPLSGKPLG